MASRIQIAKPDIVKAFEAMPPVLKGREVAMTFNQNREFWRLAKDTSLASFLSFAIDKTPLKEARFPFPQREVTGFVWGDPPLLEVLLGLVDDSFYSHYTALRIHGLTEQVPKTIFFNHEKSSQRPSAPSAPYEQEAIDSAFTKPPRASKNEIEVADQRIVFLQSANQKSLGIVAGEVNFGGERPLHLRYTSLERTLIDIAVRPFYAGGVFEVAKAFENAKDLKVSVNTMASMFKRMEFGYPYHQAIGYYLERAGFNPSRVELFRKIPMERDFYLTHQMGKTRFIPAWRLHVPAGF
jgi:predicted transcriptional regulator of viral defense system